MADPTAYRPQVRMQKPLLPEIKGTGWFFVALGLACLWIERRWGFAIDDTWITLRYAQNVAHGRGFVFNPGEHIEGYSNFLLVLFAAVFERIGIDSFDAVRVGGVVALLGSIVLVGLMEHRLTEWAKPDPKANPLAAMLAAMGGKVASLGMGREGAWIGWVGTLYLAVAPQAATWAVSGLETSYALFFALLLTFFAARTWTEEDPVRAAGLAVATGFAATALALIRADGAVLVGALLVFAVWEYARGRRASWPGAVSLAATIFVLLYLIYTFWRFSTFGGLLPNTALAKASGSLGARLSSGFDYFALWFEKGGSLALLLAAWGVVHAVRHKVAADRNATTDLGAASSASASGGATESRRSDDADAEEFFARRGESFPGARFGERAPGREGASADSAAGATAEAGERPVGPFAPTLLRLCAISLLVHVSYVVWVGGDWMPASRFMVPALGWIALLVGAGVRMLYRRGMLWKLGALLLTLTIGHSLWRGDRNDTELRSYLAHARVKKLWHPLVAPGEWLRTAAPANSLLAGSEAGIIPYYSGLRFVDMLGLVDAEIAKRPGGLHEKFDADYVLGRKPDFIVLWVSRESDADGWAKQAKVPSDGQMLKHPGFRAEYRLRMKWPRTWTDRTPEGREFLFDGEQQLFERVRNLQ